MERHLLKKEDFIVIRLGGVSYLFLSKTLQYFKITNPDIEEYLKLCVTGDTRDTFLSDDEIISIGQTLAVGEEVVEASASDISDVAHNFLILSLTSGCNLACKYCFAEITKKYNTMNFEVAKKAIDNMINQQNDRDEYNIFFFGGEPLLKKELVKQIAEYAYKEITEKDKQIKFLINTNATLIDDDTLQMFKRYNFTVTVSLDGPKMYHNRNRVYVNGKGSFQKVMKGIELLKKNNIQTNIRATFSPDTRDLVSNFEFFESLKLPYTYSFTINSEYKANLKETYFEEYQFEIIEKEMFRVMDFFYEKISRIDAIYYTGLNQKLSLVRHKKKRTHACEAGRRSIVVDDNGNYYACQNMIPYKQTVLGCVDSGFSEEKKRMFRSEELSLIDECHNCAIRNLCAGGCAVERLNPNNKTKRQMCRLFQSEWKSLLYLYALIMEAKKNKNKYDSAITVH